jgi:hypothetical protein
VLLGSGWLLPCCSHSATGKGTWFLLLSSPRASLDGHGKYYIICGDININYLVENNRKKILDALLASYNLFSIVYFPTRLHNNSATEIDNIFVDTSKFANYVIIPLFNGLSDYDTQLIKLSDVDLKIHNANVKIMRKFDAYSILEFQYKLSFETWSSVFEDNDVNTMFN